MGSAGFGLSLEFGVRAATVGAATVGACGTDDPLILAAAKTKAQLRRTLKCFPARGDDLGTAYSVLAFPGPGAEQFIVCEDDFVFGRIGATDESWGDVRLLEVIPRALLPAARN